MTKTTLYLTRHGEAAWNAQGRIMGQLDAPLTEAGTQQALWLRDRLKEQKFAAIYASSSQRTLTTAEIIRATRELPVVADDRLREIYLGNWEGMTTKEIEQQFPEELFAYRHAPERYIASNGGETFTQVKERIMPCIKELIARHRGEEILIVSHSVALKVVLGTFEQRPLENLRKPPAVLWASLSKVVIADDLTPTIEIYADTSHYQIPYQDNSTHKNVQDG